MKGIQTADAKAVATQVVPAQPIVLLGKPIGSGMCTDLATDPDNCGTCDNICPSVTNATITCAGGTCGFTCQPEFCNIDGVVSNGCEVDTTSDAQHCGDCYNDCTLLPNVAIDVECSGGTCEIISCQQGWGNCDSDVSNCCEADLQNGQSNCGSCTANCNGLTNVQIASYLSGSCVIIDCQTGYSNCDISVSNGCQTFADV